MSQWWVVGPVVLAAVLYVGRSLLPRAWRRRAPGSGGTAGCHDCAASGGQEAGRSAVTPAKR